MTLRSYVRVRVRVFLRVRVRVRVFLTLTLTLAKPCSNEKNLIFFYYDKLGRLFKKWRDFLQFFMLKFFLSLKIE